MTHYVYRIKDKSSSVKYIGQTVDIKQRASSHEQAEEGDIIEYILVPDKNMGLRVEAGLIEYYKPERNSSSGSIDKVNQEIAEAHANREWTHHKTCIGKEPPFVMINQEGISLLKTKSMINSFRFLLLHLQKDNSVFFRKSKLAEFLIEQKIAIGTYRNGICQLIKHGLVTRNEYGELFVNKNLAYVTKNWNQQSYDRRKRATLLGEIK